MDQRSSKTVTILFVLTLLISAGLFGWNNHRMAQALDADRAAVLGALAGNEVSEAHLIEAFNQDISDQNRQKGQDLEAKYGFSSRSIRQQRIFWNFYLRKLFILGGAIAILLGLFIWSLLKRQKLQKSLNELKDTYETEKAQAELLLQRTRKEDGDIKSSITDIAHQLKTPVASLKLSLEIAMSDQYSQAERQEFAQQSEVQIQKLDLMLDGLVKISQLETDLINLRPQAYPLKELLNEAVNGVIMKAIEKKIEIEMGPVSNERIFIDHKWTLEAIGNVLENAIKYSPSETTITLCLSTLVTYVLIEIIDEGPGIPVEAVNQIYQRFYRGENSEGIDGSGVGLFLTRKIIEGQGGAIMVKAQVPRGSNFQITLPLA